MKRIIGFIVFVLLLSSCRTKYIPMESRVTVTETIRDTVVEVQIEKEYVKQSVPDTTSTVETKYARSTAVWHGNTGVLEHAIENKPDSVKVILQYKDRTVEVEKPVPYPVEKKVYVDKPVRMPLRWYERILQCLGELFLLWVILTVVRNKFHR